MKSPFPGMDPYLEAPGFWGDFHHTFISSWREAIADALPESAVDAFADTSPETSTDPPSETSEASPGAEPDAGPDGPSETADGPVD